MICKRWSLSIYKIILASVCAIALSSCASVFGNKNRDVTVTSRPPGAKVYLNGTYLGHTPTTLTVDNPMDTHLVTVRKAGYEPQQKPVDTRFQPIGILNILFWPGFIVDYATGDMKKVYPTLHFDLQKG